MKIFHLCLRANSTTLCQALYLLDSRLCLISWPKSTKNGWPIYAILRIRVLMVRSIGMNLSHRLYELLYFPMRHLSYLFLKKDDILFLRLMVWLFGCVEMLNEPGMTSS